MVLRVFKNTNITPIHQLYSYAMKQIERLREEREDAFTTTQRKYNTQKYLITLIAIHMYQ
jgi:hypothetical protein